MALITLAEYARRHGRDTSTLRKSIKRLKTVQKLGHDWVIDEDEPYPADGRVKSGQYVNWRKSPKEHDDL